ncbi:MAG: homocysteine S-methyltransferase family protein [Actinomycetia bacterium]|nr:homocysteine S-methyltransferase family protein [Actinomycetes bacterium]
MGATATVTVLDGGMGRELMRIGAPFRQPEWSALALWEGPEWVVQAHRNFIEAGAHVITTNSYAIVPFHIGDDRFRADARELAALSGRLAREAAATKAGVTVAGSLPPLFGSYRPDLFDTAAAPAIIDPLVDGLRDHVDLWLGETLGSIAEAQAVGAALERSGGSTKPLWISYYLHPEQKGALASGEAVADAVSAAIELGATAVMFNCSPAEAISHAISIAVPTAAGRARIGGYANRFATAHTDTGEANSRLSEFRDDLDPASYCLLVGEWLASGATIVGGCCGMTPEHVAAIAALVA